MAERSEVKNRDILTRNFALRFKLRYAQPLLGNLSGQLIGFLTLRDLETGHFKTHLPLLGELG